MNKFTWLFLAVARADLQGKPHRESVTAPDELTARRQLAGRFVLCFAGRIPVQEVRHV
ncbi:host cell division inhibitor Icd-like protein [Salmonella enterica]|nr:host cell division inhibitor Icd-like protein [Salmonella enterica]EJH7016130.1 host cell division inhibitor Icd-like protein [Salmonella enterica]EJH7437813.1 host cell division inhibitor Icd-like protein [Salmonella enterica]EJH7877108.1 host cell division inhibitor Icd-like protein [Salmonella enterica]EJH7880980.1 host cell division inhibitor Icd-like protein [Salmonella enterica]